MTLPIASFIMSIFLCVVLFIWLLVIALNKDYKASKKAMALFISVLITEIIITGTHIYNGVF